MKKKYVRPFKNQRKIERQLRFNFLEDALKPGSFEYWILIVNHHTEIDDMRKRIKYMFDLSDEEPSNLFGRIKGAGLNYELMHFKTSRKIRADIFYSLYPKVIHDPNFKRKTPEGLKEYIDSLG